LKIRLFVFLLSVLAITLFHSVDVADTSAQGTIPTAAVYLPLVSNPSATPIPSSGNIIYVSSTSGGTVSGVRFADEDVLAYDTTTGAWSIYFDGSDVLTTTLDVDALAQLGDGSLLLSFDVAQEVGTLGMVDDSDIVRFIPSSLGSTTAGGFEWYFDGSDVELTTDGGDIDALAVLSDGRLVVSTLGSVDVTGVAGVRDEDLLIFTPTQPLGEITSGTWARYFDGSDVELSESATEDVNGTWIDPTNAEIYLTTTRAFTVTGVSGDGSDIFVCTPGSIGETTSCTFRLYWDGSVNGFDGEVTDAVESEKSGQQVNAAILSSLVNLAHDGQRRLRRAPMKRQIMRWRTTKHPNATNTPLPMTPTDLPTVALPCVIDVPSGWVPYAIQPGEDLTTIAARTNTTVASLLQVNCLTADDIQSISFLLAPPVVELPTAVATVEATVEATTVATVTAGAPITPTVAETPTTDGAVTVTATAEPTATIATDTPTPDVTSTPEATAVPTVTPTVAPEEPTATPSETLSPSPTATPEASATPEPPAAPSATSEASATTESVATTTAEATVVETPLPLETTLSLSSATPTTAVATPVPPTVSAVEPTSEVPVVEGAAVNSTTTAPPRQCRQLSCSHQRRPASAKCSQPSPRARCACLVLGWCTRRGEHSNPGNTDRRNILTPYLHSLYLVL